MCQRHVSNRSIEIVECSVLTGQTYRLVCAHINLRSYFFLKTVCMRIDWEGLYYSHTCRVEKIALDIPIADIHLYFRSRHFTTRAVKFCTHIYPYLIKNDFETMYETYECVNHVQFRQVLMGIRSNSNYRSVWCNFLREVNWQLSMKWQVGTGLMPKFFCVRISSKWFHSIYYTFLCKFSWWLWSYLPNGLRT
jgi:hypothetical protein